MGLFLRLEGRIGRRAFWIGFSAIVVCLLLLDLLSRGAGVAMVLMLVLLYPLAAVLVKRLHDRGRSGWWVAVLGAPFAAGLIAAFIARILGVGVSAIERAAWSAIWASLIALAVIAVLELGVREGDPGYSEHGPPPLA